MLEVRSQEPPEIDPNSFQEPFTPEQMEQYLLMVYHQAVTTNSLSIEYHMTVGKVFEGAILTGLGGSPQDYDLFAVYQKLRTNVYVFSAAKQYQQVRTMSKFIEKNGVRSTWKDFKEQAEEVFGEYNKNYLRAEYITAVGQSQMAEEWVNAVQQEDILPMLEYRTQRDARVRDEHAALDGITLPINHKFWNTYMPKNGWRCRCFTVQREAMPSTDLKSRDLSDLDDEKKFPKVFRMNPGKDGLIFNPAFHPYFKVAPGDANLRANNFNMPLP